MTEADVAIAQNCRPGDVAASRDSDFIIYSNITTVWRPITRYKFLVYDVRAVQVALGPNRVQLTVLGVVSKNDYGSNIYSLGPATNHSIVKTLKAEDPTKMVDECHIIINPPYKTTDPSERDCLLIWTQVFGIMAAKESILSGEGMLESSKLLRKQQAVEFGDLCDAGRKVDLAFAFEDIEVSNIEFKRPDLPNKSITIDSRKNIRLGRCIQEMHKDFGVQDPSVIMGDVFGFVGIFYQLAKMDEIWIAGKMVQSTVQIPTTPGSMESFLEGNSLASGIILSISKAKDQRSKELRSVTFEN
ncbi:unnamed protein product [Mortierella alpina]